MSPNLTASAYPELLALVRKTLVEGQAAIEHERVRIYWQTGKHIHEHIFQYQQRAEYGSELLLKLSADLGVGETLLHRCLQFARKYPSPKIFAGRQKLTWSHFRELMTIADATERKRLESRIKRHDWTSDELIARIRGKKPHQPPAPAQATPSNNPLSPSCGTPYTYQVVQRMNLKTGKSALRLDLGFGVFLNDEALLGSLPPNEIVESRKKENDTYKLYKDTRLPKDLYTYWAEIEKVIDGDTVKVRFDLGFNTEIRQTLRLRGIDCPEVDTKEGQAAKTFCQSYLKEEAFVIVHTKRSDKYDRYLADIFIPLFFKEGVGGVKQSEAISFLTRDDILKNSLYLNNLLLESGHARRYEI
jgi:endonuclease YncB( thermonuclease family)